jgi:hypothetical protein
MGAAKKPRKNPEKPFSVHDLRGAGGQAEIAGVPG